MGITCPKCNRAKLVFSDGGLSGNPSYDCPNCGATYKNEPAERPIEPEEARVTLQTDLDHSSDFQATEDYGNQEVLSITARTLEQAKQLARSKGYFISDTRVVISATKKKLGIYRLLVSQHKNRPRYY